MGITKWMFLLFCLSVNFKMVSDEVAKETGFSFLVQVNRAKKVSNCTFNRSFRVQFTDTALGNTDITVSALQALRSLQPREEFVCRFAGPSPESCYVVIKTSTGFIYIVATNFTTYCIVILTVTLFTVNLFEQCINKTMVCPFYHY